MKSRHRNKNHEQCNAGFPQDRPREKRLRNRKPGEKPLKRGAREDRGGRPPPRIPPSNSSVETNMLVLVLNGITRPLYHRGH